MALQTSLYLKDLNPGEEIQITPAEPDVLDAGGRVEGVGWLGDGSVECVGLFGLSP